MFPWSWGKASSFQIALSFRSGTLLEEAWCSLSALQEHLSPCRYPLLAESSSERAVEPELPQAHDHEMQILGLSVVMTGPSPGYFLCLDT